MIDLGYDYHRQDRGDYEYCPRFGEPKVAAQLPHTISFRPRGPLGKQPHAQQQNWPCQQERNGHQAFHDRSIAELLLTFG